VTQTKRRYPPVYPQLYWTVWRIMWLLIKTFTGGCTIEGAHHIPANGAFVLVTNHLSFIDSPVVFVAMPRIVYFLAGEKYTWHPLFGPILRVAGAIFVRRGEIDRDALRQASNALQDGFCLVIAAEGTRSKTGGLIAGKTGAAYLATHENALIVPMVVWGTEQVGPGWGKFRRAPVHVRFGQPFHLPEGRARTRQLDAYTDEIMTTMAALLPEAYRGVYRDHPLLREKLSRQI